MTTKKTPSRFAKNDFRAAALQVQTLAELAQSFAIDKRTARRFVIEHNISHNFSLDDHAPTAPKQRSYYQP